MTQTPQTVATEVNPDLLSAVCVLAQEEGRKIQSLVDEALSDLLEKHRRGESRERPRAHVMAAYQTSHDRYAALYRQLAG